MADIVLTGDTSGTITVAAPAVAGTNTLTLPASTGTIATTTDVSNSIGRNLIINGDMQISQRGTSFANASGYTLDRFTFTDTGSGEFTVSQSTDVPSGQGFASSMKLDCTTANASLGSSDQVRQVQKIEGYNLQQLSYGTSEAKSLTMSFWVKSNKTGIYCVTLSQEDNGYDSYTSEYTISAANTWEKKTLTFDGDTSGVINNDNGAGLWVMFAFGAGSGRHIAADTWAGSYGLSTSNQVNLSDNTSNELYLTGVQLEVGTVATPFEHRPYDMELARCQRYFIKSYNNDVAVGSNTWIGTFAGRNYDTDTRTSHGSSMLFPVSMRATPTLTAYSKAGTSGKGVEGSSSIDISSTEVTCTIRGSANGIRGVDMSVTGTKFYQFHFTADSEL